MSSSATRRRPRGVDAEVREDAQKLIADEEPKLPATTTPPGTNHFKKKQRRALAVDSRKGLHHGGSSRAAFSAKYHGAYRGRRVFRARRRTSSHRSSPVLSRSADNRPNLLHLLATTDGQEERDIDRPPDEEKEQRSPLN
jgi:hypothetical protein